jgi:predicted nucleotidyltransferase
MDNKAAILVTLGYFDLFQYPLTDREIYFFLPRPIPPSAFEHALGELVEEGHVFVHDGFYLLRDDASLIPRRRAGNARAAHMLVTAGRISRWLSHFPYVRGVGVSGSLSKQYADEHSDIDLFIITSAGRLWLARTLLHLLKKGSFLFRRQDWFCMNYFIDEAALEIPERNTYTAIEIVTLLPMRGVEAFTAFRKANAWTDDFLPNSYGRLVLSEESRPSWLRRALEGFLAGPAGDRLDRWLMRVTARRWQKKTAGGKRNARGIVMTLDASRHMARPDPTGFQRGLLEAYERRCGFLLKKYEVGYDNLRKEIM